MKESKKQSTNKLKRHDRPHAMLWNGTWVYYDKPMLGRARKKPLSRELMAFYREEQERVSALNAETLRGIPANQLKEIVE